MSKRSDKIADAFERIRIGATEQFDQMGVGYIELDEDEIESEGEK